MTYKMYNVYIHVWLASVFYMHMSRVWDNSTVRLVPVLQRVAIPGQLKSVNKSNVHVSGAADRVGITAREKVRLSQTRVIIPYFLT